MAGRRRLDFGSTVRHFRSRIAPITAHCPISGFTRRDGMVIIVTPRLVPGTRRHLKAPTIVVTAPKEEELSPGRTTARAPADAPSTARRCIGRPRHRHRRHRRTGARRVGYASMAVGVEKGTDSPVERVVSAALYCWPRCAVSRANRSTDLISARRRGGMRGYTSSSRSVYAEGVRSTAAAEAKAPPPRSVTRRRVSNAAANDQHLRAGWWRRRRRSGEGQGQGRSEVMGMDKSLRLLMRAERVRSRPIALSLFPDRRAALAFDYAHLAAPDTEIRSRDHAALARLPARPHR